MQSSALHLCPTSCHKLKLVLFQNANVVVNPPSLGMPLRRACLDSVCTAQLSASHQQKHPRNDCIVARATSLPESTDESSVDLIALAEPLKLGGLFSIWYLLNIYFNILNKQVLQIYPFPATVSAFQFGCGSIFSMLMWGLNLHTKPNITYSQVLAILPLALAHATGNLMTNISLGKVAVSFTHTIKAMEPFFTVLLSALFLGQIPSLWVLSSLLPIVGGVALASLTEVSFNWTGFCSVMVSNLVNQSRNVYSKKLMTQKQETLDDINLFSVMTIMSFMMLMPAAILIDGIKFTPSYLQYAIIDSGGLMTMKLLCTKLLLSAICLHYYQQVSYVILHMVSPVTHSVGNCLKRVIVIVSSVIFFQTPVSHANSLGTALALLGVFLYTKARRIKPKVKAT